MSKPKPSKFARRSFGYFRDTTKPSRIWKGYCESEGNLHYAFCDGETDPEDRLIWIQAASAQPNFIVPIDERDVFAALIRLHWHN